MSRNLRFKDANALNEFLQRSKAKPADATATAALAGVGSSTGRSGKFNAKRIQHDGLDFDSKHEGQRYLLLKARMHAGEIMGLQCHVPIAITVNEKHITTLVVDFTYRERPPLPRAPTSWPKKFEDAKGYKKGAAWEMFRLKAALVKALYDIDVEVV